MNAKQKHDITRNVFFVQEPEIPGIYFLFNKGMEVVYVGSSEDVFSRIRTHRSNKKFKFVCASYIVDSDRDKRRVREAEYIKFLSPKYNLRSNPEWMDCMEKAKEHLIATGRENQIPKNRILSWYITKEILTKELGVDIDVVKITDYDLLKKETA